MRAICTWGDGPDVMLDLDGTFALLLEDPAHKNRATHGLVSAAQIDLTCEEARRLANEILQAVSHCEELENVLDNCNKHHI